MQPLFSPYHLIGLVLKVSESREEDPGSVPEIHLHVAGTLSNQQQQPSSDTNRATSLA